MKAKVEIDNYFHPVDEIIEIGSLVTEMRCGYTDEVYLVVSKSENYCDVYGLKYKTLIKGVSMIFMKLYYGKIILTQ
jgi:hypothetical protein